MLMRKDKQKENTSIEKVKYQVIVIADDYLGDLAAFDSNTPAVPLG